jgi:alpha-glucosidase
MFYPQQPDLNWRNPEVVEAMHDGLRFWLDKGVAGFRLDAVDTMFEDAKLTDDPVLEGTNQFGDPNVDLSNQHLAPEMHQALTGFLKVADPYGAVLIGETWTSDIAALNAYYGKNNDEVQLPMDFLITQINKFDVAKFRKEIAAVNAANGWPTYVMSNHDIVRSINRYAPEGADKNQVAKLLATLLMTLRGTPIMYYGEEIAMVNNDPKRVEDVLDPIGKLGWPKNKGRDGERTPMQWNASTNAGFSTSNKTWLPVHENYKTLNVAAEMKDPTSVLNYYKKIIALRKNNPALHEGTYTPVNENDDNVFAYTREYKGTKVLVALNMSGTPQTVKFDVGTTATTLASSGKATPKTMKLSAVKLGPYESYVGEVK